jgi:ribosomal protein S18 acetylase RimI-like enzyme
MGNGRLDMLIRPATTGDDNAILEIIMPVIRSGETYALPRDWMEAQALSYWRSPDHEVFVAADGGAVLGTCYVRPNQRGGGRHVANAAFMTRASAAGRGVASALCAHALDHAAAAGYAAMQFNFVVATNTRAVALWERFGFAVVGRLPGAFRHPAHGFVDALVMYRKL